MGSELQLVANVFAGLERFAQNRHDCRGLRILFKAAELRMQCSKSQLFSPRHEALWRNFDAKLRTSLPAALAPTLP